MKNFSLRRMRSISGLIHAVQCACRTTRRLALGSFEHLEQQILVAVRRVMLETLLIDPVHFRGDLRRLLRRKKAPDDGVALRLHFVDDFLHGAPPIK